MAVDIRAEIVRSRGVDVDTRGDRRAIGHGEGVFDADSHRPIRGEVGNHVARLVDGLARVRRIGILEARILVGQRAQIQRDETVVPRRSPKLELDAADVHRGHVGQDAQGLVDAEDRVVVGNLNAFLLVAVVHHEHVGHDLHAAVRERALEAEFVVGHMLRTVGKELVDSGQVGVDLGVEATGEETFRIEGIDHAALQRAGRIQMAGDADHRRHRVEGVGGRIVEPFSDGRIEGNTPGELAHRRPVGSEGSARPPVHHVAVRAAGDHFLDTAPIDSGFHVPELAIVAGGTGAQVQGPVVVEIVGNVPEQRRGTRSRSVTC